jgi:hypothetical protein
MKTQLSKPVRSKASYTEQYKQEALELWRSSGRSAAKVATGISATRAVAAFFISGRVGVSPEMPVRLGLLASCQNNLSKFVIARRDHRRARRPPYPSEGDNEKARRGWQEEVSEDLP